MMDKSKYKTLSIALEIETLKKLNDYCRDRTVKSIFVRHLIKKELSKKFGEKLDTSKHKIVKIKVDNYDELKTYVEAKRLGSIKNLMTFATAQYMKRYPLQESEYKKLKSLEMSVD